MFQSSSFLVILDHPLNAVGLKEPISSGGVAILHVIGLLETLQVQTVADSYVLYSILWQVFFVSQPWPLENAKIQDTMEIY